VENVFPLQKQVWKEGWTGKGGKSTGDGRNGGNCTGDPGWNTSELFLP
jgi:hypothetical protein